jgi:hypothetical protein
MRRGLVEAAGSRQWRVVPRPGPAQRSRRVRVGIGTCMPRIARRTSTARLGRRLLRLCEREPAERLTTCPLRTTKDSAGPDCRNLAMRKYASWHGCRPTLRPAALPVAEQRSRAGAVTGVRVKQRPSNRPRRVRGPPNPSAPPPSLASPLSPSSHEVANDAPGGWGSVREPDPGSVGDRSAADPVARLA